MHTRWFLVALALIGAALACNLDPFLISVPTSDLKPSYVESVAVTPASGSGSFTLEVVTSASPQSDSSIVAETVGCYYVTPGGATMAIGSVFPPGEGGTRTYTLTFTVSEPGDYTATCENENSTSKKSAQFTVSDYLTATSTATSTATGTPTTTPTATLELSALKGRIVFDYNGYQSSRPNGGKELYYFSQWCIPEVTITPDGGVSGTCEYSGRAHTVSSTVIAHVTGLAVQTGSGNFTSATQASGTAIFDFSCDSGSDNLIWCNTDTREFFSGTIPWSFVASP